MIEILNQTRKTVPKIPWEKIMETILSKNYNLSLVLAGNGLLKNLNKKYRKKNKTADTLSFALDKNNGEVFLNINNSPAQLAFLFIHSLLHLKGHEHGREMSRLHFVFQKNLLKYLYGARNRDGNRRRNIRGKNRHP